MKLGRPDVTKRHGTVWVDGNALAPGDPVQLVTYRHTEDGWKPDLITGLLVDVNRAWWRLVTDDGVRLYSARDYQLCIA